MSIPNCVLRRGTNSLVNTNIITTLIKDRQSAEDMVNPTFTERPPPPNKVVNAHVILVFTTLLGGGGHSMKVVFAMACTDCRLFFSVVMLFVFTSLLFPRLNTQLDILIQPVLYYAFLVLHNSVMIHN